VRARRNACLLVLALLSGACGAPSGPGPTDAGHVVPPNQDDRFGPPPPFAEGEQTVLDPFVGVRILSRQTDVPRPLHYHVVLIDPGAEGVSFAVTPPNGDAPRDTTRQTTREFLADTGASLAINAHFFSPWPPEDDYATLLGLAVSDGDAYSPFEPGWEVALAFDGEGTAAIVRWMAEDTTGWATDPPMDVAHAVGTNEQIVTAGMNTASSEALHPRTAVGVSFAGHVLFMIVDGRQEGISEGMGTPEVADVLISLDAADAINLDGGGSTTLAMADPEPTLVNVPVGYIVPGTERHNGSNLAVHALPFPPDGPQPVLGRLQSGAPLH
jgi:hypothetical protein